MIGILKNFRHQFGIDICSIQPGDHRNVTCIVTEEKAKAIGSKMWSNISESIRKEYGKEFDDFIRDAYSRDTASGSNPTTDGVMECVDKDMLDKRPRVR